ncbi:nuclear transport factor 2 family protein [Streptomyces griseus]
MKATAGRCGASSPETGRNSTADGAAADGPAAPSACPPRRLDIVPRPPSLRRPGARTISLQAIGQRENEDGVTAEPRDVAVAYFNAWRSKRFDDLRLLLSDGTFSYSGPLAEIDNADECRDTLARLGGVMTDLVVERSFVSDADVVTFFTVHTSVASPNKVANWLHVEDGRITSIRAVYDAREMASI